MRNDVSRKRRAKSRGLGHALRAGFSVWLLRKRKMSSWNSGVIWLDKARIKIDTGKSAFSRRKKGGSVQL